MINLTYLPPYRLHIQGENGISANTDSGLLFGFFSKVTTIEGLEYFDTTNVTNMFGMFTGCSSLIDLDLSNFDTANVTNMSYMFSGCEGLTSLDLSNFDITNVTDMESMFNLEKVDCLITVRDEATKNWVLERNNSLTNIVVKSA